MENFLMKHVLNLVMIVMMDFCVKAMDSKLFARLVITAQTISSIHVRMVIIVC